MSGNSWGHTIKPLKAIHSSYGNPLLCSTTTGRGSKRQHCQEPARYETSYRYVTGQRRFPVGVWNRTTTNSRQACASHAQLFADKHSLELPAAPLLHLHKWQPGQAYAGVEQCLQCGLYRTRGKDRLGLFTGYSSDSDLTFCTPRDAVGGAA